MAPVTDELCAEPFLPLLQPMHVRLPPFPRLSLLPVAVLVAACVEQSPTAAMPSDIDRIRAVIIEEPPPGPACTYTQGYWKSHPELWDDGEDAMPFLTSDAFYNSGVSNLTILRMPPKGGNAYEILAHQYIAALLNLNGAAAGVVEVDDALAGTSNYFSSEAAGIPHPQEPTRSQLVDWAATLDQFNQGIIGPGHCS